MTYTERLLKVIPGGAHTYSRGYDQYPENAPEILVRGDGAYVYDENDKRYLDYGMALRAVNLGYGVDEVDNAAWKQIKYGNNLTRPSMVELEAAEAFVELIDSVDMVKFTKNGSTAVSAAVKLSRAYTGKTLIARCKDHPFFSYDDWFIGSTPITRGVPKETIDQTLMFSFNDIGSLQRLFDENPGQLSCVVLEPSTSVHPCPSVEVEGENFLHDVQRLCKKNGAVFVLDEMITGFRWDIKGAQHYYNVQPDLSTFGKAMANGFSVAAIAGKREIMKLGSIEFEGQERVFLLSTTHGAEMCGMGAFLATVEYLKEHQVISHFWDYGKRLVDTFNSCAEKAGVGEYFKGVGIECSPNYLTYNKAGELDLGLRTLFSQEMLNNGVLCPWLALSFAHKDEELQITEHALSETMKTYAKALESGYEKFLVGPAIKPVFRKFN